MTYGRPGVYLSERTLPAPISSNGTANAAGAAIGVFEKGPLEVTLVTSWYDFVKKFGDYSTSYPSTFGVSQFFRNGGTELYVRRVLHTDATEASDALADTTSGTIGTFYAKNKGSDGNFLRVKVSEAGTVGGVTSGSAENRLYDVTVYQEAGTNNNSTTDDVILELWQNVRLDDAASSDYISTVLLTSDYVRFTRTDATPGIPSDSLNVLSGGSNGTSPVTIEAFTDAAFAEFSALERPLVIFSPNVWSASPGAAVAINNKLVTWAAANNSFAVLDTNYGLSVSDAVSAAGAINSGNSTPYAAVYYPGVYIADPLGRSSASLRLVGAASSVAGLYLATDRLTGPFKSPAGVRTQIQGAVSPEKVLTATELDTLNTSSKPVNAIRSVPGAGIVVMGARTLQQDGTANRYVAMRRSLNYLRKSMTDLTQFAVFENNNETLWKQIRTVLGVFLNDYRNRGGLRGASPTEAYFVKCDAENNTAENIAAGIVNIEVGVALEYPAEFITISLSQKTIN